MSEGVNFPFLYDAQAESNFNEALEREELEEARGYLESMVSPSCHKERLQRTANLVAGYKFLLDAYKSGLGDALVPLSQSQKNGQQLSEYQKLGTPDELKERLQELEDYGGLGDPNEIEEKLEQLEKLEGLISETL